MALPWRGASDVASGHLRPELSGECIYIYIYNIIYICVCQLLTSGLLAHDLEVYPCSHPRRDEQRGCFPLNLGGLLHGAVCGGCEGLQVLASVPLQMVQSL